MIGTLIKKDILLKVKNPSGFLLLVAMPLLFALLLGLVFGPRSSEGPTPKTRLLIEDHDQSFASQFVAGAFGRGEMANMFEVTTVDSGAGRGMMNEGKGSALLIIPKGFGQALLDEKPAEWVLVKNPSETYAPQIAEETLSILAEAGTRLVWLASGPIRTIREHADSDREFTNTEIALLSIQVYQMIRKVDDILFPPALSLKQISVGEEKKETPRSVLYVYFLAGVSIFSLLFLMEALARDFHTEMETHTLHRQLAGPLSRGTYVFSKLTFLWITGLAAHFLVWLAAGALFGIRLPVNLWGSFVLFSVILVASLTGIIGLLYALARNRNQAQAMAPALIIFFGMVGGAMIPAENLPAFMKPVSLVSPVFWGQDAIKKMFWENLSITAFGMNLLVLGAIALVFNLLTVVFFDRKFHP